MEKLTVCELHPFGGTTKGSYHVNLPPAADYQSYHSKAVFHSSLYQSFYGTKCNASSQDKRRSSIVKISFFNPKTQKKESIYREFVAIGVTNLDATMVGLTFQSLHELGISNDILSKGCEVEVTTGCWWNYYWNHPNSTIRGPWKLAVIAFIVTVILSMLSIFLTIFK